MRRTSRDAINGPEGRGPGADAGARRASTGPEGFPPVPVADFHVHTTLKPYLFARSLWRETRAPRRFSPFSFRSGLPALLRGGVRLTVVAHHVPEEALFRDSFLARAAGRLLSPTYPWLREGRPFARLEEMMALLEWEAELAPERVAVVRSPSALRRTRESGKLALVHAVEGAHVLEGDPDRVDELADAGVATMTLAHLYPNDVAAGVDGVPDYPLVRALSRFRFDRGSIPPLTELGREVVRRMTRAGMIVDVAHAAPEARREILEEVGGRRPVVASHVGLRALNDRGYNLSDGEVREIARTGGAVGVILMPFWLTGRRGDGLDAVWRTMRRVRYLTGSWRHVMIGSDFDGFTRPPREVPDAAHMGRLTRMLDERGVPPDGVRRIMGNNALRVLEDGWGGAGG